MRAEMWAGLFSLGGAVIGAGGAILGAWFQQRHQAKTAGEQRREERRYTSGQAALDMLIRLRHAAANRAEGDDESESAWTDQLVEWSTSFDAALFLVPGGDEMRERVFEVVRHLGYYDMLGQNHREANGWLDQVCGEAITILSAFLREDLLPPQSSVFLDRQDMIAAYLRDQADRS
ncbi:hypothetical protein ACQEVY_01180 [Streptomyces sp. CA-288835]|uniref:hypothetical protein n=1 Tax=Streptomyces sp. CA-288835 TaxID=3240069 RepID=UPI003D8D74BB